MKNVFNYLFVLLIALLVPSLASASLEPEQAQAFLQPILDMIMTYVPSNVVAVLLMIGGARVLFKPLFAFLEAVTLYTPTKKDDEILGMVKSSAIYKWVVFAFDLLASIKLPVKK